MSTKTNSLEESSLTDKGRLATRPDRFEVGDKVLWKSRSSPLDVIEAAHQDGEHSAPMEIALEGPQEGIVVVSYEKHGNYWQTNTDGKVDTIVITEDSENRPITLATDEPYTTTWETPADPCPHCSDAERYTRDRFRCDYLKTDFYTDSRKDTGREYHQYQDGDGLPKRLVRALCQDCGGVVYEHPAYKLITEEDIKEI